MEQQTGLDVAFEDIDSLIAELETQFGDSQTLPMIKAANTEGCTQAATCTGSCPC